MVISVLTRPGDAPGYALRLRAQMLALEPTLNVTLDAAATSDVLVVLVGPAWQQSAPADDVVATIDAAIHARRRVVPVLVQGGRMPEGAMLPSGLKAFAMINGRALHNDAFEAGVRELLDEVHRREAPASWRDGGVTGRLQIVSIRPGMLTRVLATLDPEQPVNVRIDGTIHGSLHLFGDELTVSVPPGRHEVLLRSRWEDPFAVDVPPTGTLVVTVSRNPVTGGVTVVSQSTRV